MKRLWLARLGKNGEFALDALDKSLLSIGFNMTADLSGAKRFNVWVEPALVAVWIRIMKNYLADQRRPVAEETFHVATRWSYPERDVRELALRPPETRPPFLRVDRQKAREGLLGHLSGLPLVRAAVRRPLESVAGVVIR
jgi:hypothetical protein